jgi:hypothetical protein
MKSCQPGQSVGDPSTSQFTCPPESKYYRELDIYKVAGDVETSLKQQDNSVGELLNQASEFQLRANNLLGDNKGDIGVGASGSNFELDSKLADFQKNINATNQSLQMTYSKKLQLQALQKAIDENKKIMADAKYHYDIHDNDIDNKTKIVNINLASYRSKKTLINRLTYIIYFIIFTIVISTVYSTGYITKTAIIGSIFIAFIILIVVIITDSGGLMKYGDVSMDTTKEGTKGFFNVIGTGSCPKKCKVKKPYYITHPNSSKELNDNIDILPVDWKGGKSPDETINFFRKGKFGQYRCKWDNKSSLRPSYEKEIVNSNVPCDYLDNRVNV